MDAQQFLDSPQAIRQQLVELASTSESWSFYVDRINLASTKTAVWRDLSAHFHRVRHAFVGFEPGTTDSDAIRLLEDSGALRIAARENNVIHQGIFWFEFETRCVAIVGSIDSLNEVSHDGLSVAIATTCDRTSTFSDSVNEFLKRCRVNSKDPVHRQPVAIEKSVANSQMFHKRHRSAEAVATAVSNDNGAPRDDFLTKFGSLHREFSDVTILKKLKLIQSDSAISGREGGLIARCKSRYDFTTRHWDSLVGLYRCPDCIRVILIPRQRKWYDYLGLCLLLRPWVCPHCYNGYVRAII